MSTIVLSVSLKSVFEIKRLNSSIKSINNSPFLLVLELNENLASLDPSLAFRSPSIVNGYLLNGSKKCCIEILNFY